MKLSLVKPGIHDQFLIACRKKGLCWGCFCKYRVCEIEWKSHLSKTEKVGMYNIVHHKFFENHEFLRLRFPFSFCRLHKVIWGCHGISSGDQESGIVIGGTDNGHIYVYDAAAILAGDAANAIALQLDKHTGPVQALDINVFQENLLASGKIFFICKHFIKICTKKAKM